MESLISVNEKFMSVNPKELIELIKNSKYTKGLEIYIDINSDYQVKYLDDLIFELKRNNLILQIHGQSELPLDIQKNFMKKLEDYSDYLNQKIVVTLHSILNEDKKKSADITQEYMYNLTDFINNNKILISLENLNDRDGLDRLEKECIEPIVLNNENLYFTYDIGHEIIDHGTITNLDKFMISEIKNIHIHTNDGIQKDHIPIYKNDPNWNIIIKSLLYLLNNKYDGNIVFEYDLMECNGDTIKEKIIEYLNSMDLVSEHYKR